MAQESRSGLFHLETPPSASPLSQGLRLVETALSSPSLLHAEHPPGPASTAGFSGPRPPQFED